MNLELEKRLDDFERRMDSAFKEFETQQKAEYERFSALIAENEKKLDGFINLGYGLCIHKDDLAYLLKQMGFNPTSYERLSTKKEPGDIYLGQGLYIHKRDIAHLLSRLGFEPTIFNSTQGNNSND